ncbi:putative demethylmenaquinone methyltransferase [Streptomyces himastatinicus ATCC 53653]|uniref:Putative demethylmenaquinone methyltransferase n=1 Tax=Streptomyces himastatinicus ATCC 53653 TaxID=457427 RepID=D9W5X3_9ACTN|nr:putative demethylmenaquinone methyltransferase [Streptomyces himastatinicus]EFL20329.1 putative demethylmenaquinone methyltransferase [Streptomyces himastatinicus ATCC 53653]
MTVWSGLTDAVANSETDDRTPSGISARPLPGAVTDTDALQDPRTGIPVHARGSTCLTTKKLDGTRGHRRVPVDIGGVRIEPGDVILGDANGVIALAPDTLAAVLHDAELSDRAEPGLLRRIVGAGYGGLHPSVTPGPSRPVAWVERQPVRQCRQERPVARAEPDVSFAELAFQGRDLVSANLSRIITLYPGDLVFTGTLPESARAAKPGGSPPPGSSCAAGSTESASSTRSSRVPGGITP